MLDRNEGAQGTLAVSRERYDDGYVGAVDCGVGDCGVVRQVVARSSSAEKRRLPCTREAEKVAWPSTSRTCLIYSS